MGPGMPASGFLRGIEKEEGICMRLEQECGQGIMQKDSGHAHNFVSLLPPGSRVKSSRKEPTLVQSLWPRAYVGPAGD